MAASAFSVLVSKHDSMASVDDWSQEAGADLARAGWPGSNG
jgi:hypothetical protein